jgi:hypothetical protein
MIRIAGGAVALALVAAAAYPQDKHPPKTVDVKVRISIPAGDAIPEDTKVEVSAQEQSCGEMNDPRKGADTNGEALFPKLPACVVSIKALLKGYIQVGIEMNGKKLTSRAVDLREYANSISIMMERER